MFTAAQSFLLCYTDSSSPRAAWYQGIKKKMHRQIFQRLLHEDTSAMDEKETEIFLSHVKALVAAYSRCDSKEAAMRKLYA